MSEQNNTTTGTNAPKQTTEEIRAGYAQAVQKTTDDLSKASDVLAGAEASLKAGQESNAANPNSGINTTVAKDAEGNAIGTYDWDAQAENTAKNVYNSEVLAAKQDAAAAKTELAANQREGQVQYDMAQYASNQSAEKAGWTGGYILDANRQVAFLKESIKANLYSQEELQKYGYDTALAAARANYDLKKSELAMQNYNTAVQNAFQMAEFTGKFISPETSYHLSQFNTAQKIIDSGVTGEELTKAQNVQAAVNSWFETNGISKNGVYCISVLMNNFSVAATAAAQLKEQLVNVQEAWGAFDLQLDSTRNTASERNKDIARTHIFSYVDEYGDIQEVTAPVASAAAEGKIPDAIPEDQRAEYLRYVGDFITSAVETGVKNYIAAYTFTSTEEAVACANAELKEQLKAINMNNAFVNTFKFTCKINGVDVTLEIGGNTVENCKKLPGEKPAGKTPETYSPTTESTPENPTQESDALSVTSAVTFKEDEKTLGIFGSTETGKAGNNFTVKDSNHIEYRIQYSGKVVNLEAKENATLKSLITGATSQGTLPEGRVFGYKDKLYIYKEGAIYGIEARPLEISSYQKLYDTIFKGGSAAEKARQEAVTDNMDKNAKSPSMF